MARLGEVLRDNIWQFVGAVIGIVGIIVAVVVAYQIFLAERPVKKLEVVILANSSVIEVEEAVEEDIELLYKGQTVESLSLVQIRLENTGNQPITVEDYVGNSRFLFPEGSRVVGANIVEESPANIGTGVLATGYNVGALAPGLLNPGDRVIIRFLVVDLPARGLSAPFEVDVRIVGVKQVNVVSAIEQRGEQAQSGLADIGPARWIGLVVSVFVLIASAGLMMMATRNRTKRTLQEQIEEDQ